MSAPRRLRAEISGIVQGVGFRPFLHRLARRLGLTGWARNTACGVELEAEGSPEALAAFLREVEASPPPLAVVEALRAEPLPAPAGYRDFALRPSVAGEGATFVSPDVAMCPDCARELADPADRRYRYPFLNCTNCGPRFTIVRALPYDRKNTVMASFPMCPDCAAEYRDLGNRRYHAQPDCCPACGPRAFYLLPDGSEAQGDPFQLAQQTLARGGIVAVKGVGGVHLACDARQEQAVLRLRRRKRREEKPLALMCRSMAEANALCRVTPAEERLLASPRRPIVLLEKRRPEEFPALSRTRRLGVMLPYTPLHALLLDGRFGGPGAVVMTSGNPSGCPAVLRNEEALAALAAVADGFLLHDRPIQNRCDDSLVMEWEGREYFFRRSRGYAPQPVTLPFDGEGVAAFGAEQKASFALGRGRYAFLSQHIGDLKNLETLEHYRQAMETYRGLFRITPTLLACDMHPDFFSAREAEALAARESLPLIRVQHHWAHMAACMADNGLPGPVFALVWDGTGLGTDGAVWGGECLEGGYEGFARRGSLRPILLPGGDAAVEEIGRIALSLLRDAGLPAGDAPLPPARRAAVEAMLRSGTACPPASSMGRLFDGVYALLAGAGRAGYEGQGAVLLEAMVRGDVPGKRYPTAFYQEGGLRWFDHRPLLRALWEDLRRGEPPAAMARGFLDALCRMALEQCLALNQNRLPVVLSGGVFLNRYLLENLPPLLRQAGFSVYTHRRVSPSDEGIALGQLAVAAAQRRKKSHVPGSPA